MASDRLKEAMKGTFLTSQKYKCRDCGHIDTSYGDMVDGEIVEETFDPCDECGSNSLHWLIAVPQIDRWSETGFPYFDRGLGMQLESKKHRESVMKERGLTCYDGDVDFSEPLSKIERKNQREKAIVADLKDRMENSPEYAGWRKQQDQKKKLKESKSE